MATNEQRGTNYTGPPKMPKPKWWQNIFSKGYEAQLAQYQNDYNYWMWQKENEYNTPASQVQRYADAGLSTNLMYDQGTPGNSDSVKPSATGPGADSNIDPINLLSYMTDAKMKLSQIKSIDADTQLKYRQANLMSQELEAKNLRWKDIGGNILPFDPDTMTVYQRQEYEKMMKDIAAAKSERERADLLEKTKNWFVSMAISQMFSSGVGTIARFF
jgi:hypothetical protein